MAGEVWQRRPHHKHIAFPAGPYGRRNPREDVMTEHRLGLASRNRNRIAGCLFGGMAYLALTAGTAAAGPAAATGGVAGTAVTPGAPAGLPATERGLPGVGVTQKVDPKKVHAMRLCLLLAGAPVREALAGAAMGEAFNLCAPCVRAAPTTGANPAALMQCINQQRNPGGGASAGGTDAG